MDNQYHLGMKICIWEEITDPDNRTVTVVQEVIVTITAMKTNVPLEFTGEPSEGVGLRAVSDSGDTYEKHWDEWPYTQVGDPSSRWTDRTDGVGDDTGLWRPIESHRAHNRLVLENRKLPATGQFSRIYPSGETALPKGDLAYCEKHDYYCYTSSRCFPCMVAARKAA